MMDNPDPVRRVYPPRAIMQSSMKQIKNNQFDMDLLYCMARELSS
ncbi:MULTISPECIES: hypothetical protein [Commensalibacter]|nr:MULTISPECIES: hypothetical protein [Commensalibacter]